MTLAMTGDMVASTDFILDKRVLMILDMRPLNQNPRIIMTSPDNILPA
jgi:hypothetical protein